MSARLPGLANGGRRRMLQRLVAVGIAQGAMAVVTALTVRYIIDNLMQSGVQPQSDLLTWTTIALLAAAAGTAWLRWRERVEAEYLGQDYVREVRLTLFRHLSKVPARDLQRRRNGGVMLRFVGDLGALRQWVSLGVARLIVAGLTLSGVLCALLLVAWKFALVVAVAVCVGAVLTWRLGKPLHRAVRETRRHHARLAGNIGEKTAAMGVVQAFGQWRREQRRVGRQSDRLYRAATGRADYLGRLRAVAEITAAIASGCVLMLGVWEVSALRTTPGAVVAAMMLVGLLIPSLRGLGRAHEYWQGARVSRDNLQRLFHSAKRLPLRAGAGELRFEQGRIELSGLAVAGSLQPTTVCVAAGQRIALVGANGAGKSTLLAAVARLIDIEAGRVLVDGQDLARCSLASVRSHIGVVSPDLPLLQGSIEYNIRYRRPGCDAAALARVARWCDLERLYAELPQGSATRLTEGGANLSLGQRARIALARALYGNPGILLLDEVDANLDPNSSRLIEGILRDYRGTVLLATHRSQLLSRVDRIWELGEGRLTERMPVLGSGGVVSGGHPQLVLAS